MIKRILVALDPDLDTAIAVQYAIDMAQRYDAEIDAIAVVDLEAIESSSRGGGIGSFYYAERLSERLTEESRDVARTLLSQFEDVMAGSGIPHADFMREGVPFERIVEDMKYHDILVMGKDPHFFYAHPKKDTNTVARVVKNTVAPTLVVGSEFRAVRKVLIAYDGSHAAARAVRRFVHLVPFGLDVDVEILTVYQKDSKEADLMLQLSCKYIESHGYSAKTIAISGSDPKKEIVKYANTVGVDVVVSGAHAVSALKRIAFGSTTNTLLRECPTPLFVDS